MRRFRSVGSVRTGMSVSERLQLASMVGTLVILALLMGRLRDADTIRAVDRVFGPLFRGTDSTAVATEFTTGSPNSAAVNGSTDGGGPTGSDGSEESGGSGASGEGSDGLVIPETGTPGEGDEPGKVGTFESSGKASGTENLVKTGNASGTEGRSDLPFLTDVPWDTDPEEVDRFRRNAAAITDRTTGGDRYDMPAYRQLVSWSAAQSFSQMAERAMVGVDYHEMTQRPEKYRGRLIRLTIDARRILRCPPTDWNQSPELPLYEIWGPLPNTGARLVTVISVGLPPGITTGDQMERIEFVGYFYKTLAYETGLSDEGRARLAPALIGRIRYVPASAPQVSGTDYQILWGAVVIMILIGISAAIVAWRGRRHVQPAEPVVRVQRTQAWLDDVARRKTLPEDSSSPWSSRNSSTSEASVSEPPSQESR
ncbi:MAG: hypothetical protein Q4C47_01815 [Planctomycetia bacterium]|nr:hypothetical protein [Planctomycetia bacterium]